VNNEEDLYFDADLEDENDPIYKEEIFSAYADMGWTSADLGNVTEQEKAEYAAWIDKQRLLAGEGSDTK